MVGQPSRFSQDMAEQLAAQFGDEPSEELTTEQLVEVLGITVEHDGNVNPHELCNAFLHVQERTEYQQLTRPQKLWVLRCGNELLSQGFF